MPVRYAVANGAWSSGSTWDNGAVPVTGDDVYANGFNVTIDQNINVLRLSNTVSPVRVPALATAQMTSNTTPSGVVFASSFRAAGDPYYAFDQNSSTAWQSNTNLTGIIGYQFPTAKMIKQYLFLMTAGGQFNPSNWTFEGSNDGTNYTILETVTSFPSAPSTWYTRSLASNTSSFTYYRMNITNTAAGNGWPVIVELQMSESTGSIYATSSGGTFYINNDVNINVSSSLILTPGTNLLIISSSNSASINCPTMSGTTGNIIVMQTSSSLNYTGSVQIGAVGTGIAHGSKGVLNLSGSVSTNNVNGNVGISMTNGGTLNMIGTVTGGTAATQQSIIAQAPSCSINLTGNVIGGAGGSAVAITLGTNLGNGNISLTVNGNVIGNGSAGISAAFGVSNIVITGSLIDNGASAYIDTQFGAGSNLIVSGSVIGSRATAATINKTTAGGNITVIGPVYAGLSAGGIAASAGNVFTTGPFYNVNNRNAVFAQNLQLISGSTPTWTFDTETNLEQRTLYPANYPGNFPATTNVRQGITFGDTGQFVGVVAIPSASNVIQGVPVDNTTGSASFNTQNAWGFPTASLTATGSIGARLRNASTVATDAILITSKKKL